MYRYTGPDYDPLSSAASGTDAIKNTRCPILHCHTHTYSSGDGPPSLAYSTTTPQDTNLILIHHQLYHMNTQQTL